MVVAGSIKSFIWIVTNYFIDQDREKQRLDKKFKNHIKVEVAANRTEMEG